MKRLYGYQEPPPGWIVVKTSRGWITLQEQWEGRFFPAIVDGTTGQIIVWRGKTGRRDAVLAIREVERDNEVRRLQAENEMLRALLPTEGERETALVSSA